MGARVARERAVGGEEKVAASAAAVPLSALAPRHVVLCFGDSLTEGFCCGGASFRPYTESLERALRRACSEDPPLIVNAGLSGETTKLMLTRLPKFLSAEANVSVVLLLGGTNDLGRGVLPDVLLKQLFKLHGMIHRAGAVSGVLSIPEIRTRSLKDDAGEESKEHDVLRTINERRLHVNRELQAFAQRESGRAFFVDISAAFPQDAAHEDHWEPDGVHFSAEGYEALGEVLFREALLPPAALAAGKVAAGGAGRFFSAPAICQRICRRRPPATA